jgi:hypothetical protein
MPTAGTRGVVPPLEPKHLAWDTPSGDVCELDSRTDRWRQVSQDAVDLLALDESRSHVPLLKHRNVRHVHQLAVLSRQVEDALQRRQLAIDFTVRLAPFPSIVVSLGSRSACSGSVTTRSG